MERERSLQHCVGGTLVIKASTIGIPNHWLDFWCSWHSWGQAHPGLFLLLCRCFDSSSAFVSIHCVPRPTLLSGRWRLHQVIRGSSQGTLIWSGGKSLRRLPLGCMLLFKARTTQPYCTANFWQLFCTIFILSCVFCSIVRSLYNCVKCLSLV